MTDVLLERSSLQRAAFYRRYNELLEKQATHGQSPEALFITCSDARVVPEQLLGALPGQLFMLRTIANIVPPYWQTEIAMASALEFAVLELEVPHVVVCGHIDCGGILALDRRVDMIKQPALSRWIDLARPAALQVDSSSAALQGEARHQAIVEENVLLQLRNLASYPYVSAAVQAKRLQLHGWVYYLDRQQIGYFEVASGKFRLG